MALPLYLAQTATEMAGNPLPGKMAYLACHFSPGGNGLTNLPDSLPAGSILILDDSIPMDGHEPDLIRQQLSRAIAGLCCDALVLDFQRQKIPQQQELAKLLAAALPCPVVVSEIYARGLSCPVFLPPVPQDMPLNGHLAPWAGREIWLEAALEGLSLILTEAGCTLEPLWDYPKDGLAHQNLHCHYSVELSSDSAVFHLWRTGPDLDALLAEAETLGVTGVVGLWQELGESP